MKQLTTDDLRKILGHKEYWGSRAPELNDEEIIELFGKILRKTYEELVYGNVPRISKIEKHIHHHYDDDDYSM